MGCSSAPCQDRAARDLWPICIALPPCSARKQAPAASPCAARDLARMPGWDMGMMKGSPRASTSHRAPSRMPMRATGPAQRVPSVGSAAVALPTDTDCAPTPPPSDATLITCLPAAHRAMWQLSSVLTHLNCPSQTYRNNQQLPCQHMLCMTMSSLDVCGQSVVEDMQSSGCASRRKLYLSKDGCCSWLKSNEYAVHHGR